jgi:hypothetical protein
LRLQAENLYTCFSWRFQGEVLKISGFGSFAVREKKNRNGRNPQGLINLLYADL